MQEIDGVPKRLILSGEGLEQMTPGQFETFVKNLGRMGIEANTTDSIQEERSVEQLDDADKVTHKKLHEFAQANGYSEPLANRVWNSLQSAYVYKRNANEKRRKGEPVHDTYTDLEREQVQIEFEEGDFYLSRGILTPQRALTTARLDSLNETVSWLFKEGGYNQYQLPINKFGPRSLSFIAHYVNESLNPDEPYQVKFHPDAKDEYSPETIPSAEEYEVDAESPYIETVTIGEEAVKVVSVNAIREFCKTIYIKGNRTSHLLYLFDEIAKVLVHDVPAKINQKEPEVVADGLVYLRTKIPNGYRQDRRVEWGVEPDTFVGLMRDHQDGRLALEGMSEFLTFIVTNYIKAIEHRANPNL